MNRSTRKRTFGFTLIELMIVVAVVAILAAIVVPSYQKYVRQARRADVKAFLTDLQMRQERWRAERPSFATAAELGVAGLLTSHSSAQWYTITITKTDTDYTLTATATGAQAADKQGATSCTPLVMTKLTKTPAACW